jgi:hypothetical protein
VVEEVFRRPELLGLLYSAGLMPSIWLVAAALTLSGAADMVSGVFGGTAWNQTVPEHMHGRLAASGC